METLPDNIVKLTDSEQLAKRARNEFVDLAEKAIQKTNRFTVAISGGHTPERFYQLLENCELEWSKIHIFWADERAVFPDDQASNYRLAAETFLNSVPIPEANVHRMYGEAEDLEQAARDYERTLRNVFGLKEGQFPNFDLVVLGMGADGHIGSIKPDTYALFDTEDLVSTVFQMEDDYSRITLTLPVLRAAKRIMVLVSGQEKASIVCKIFHGTPDPVRYPVHALWPVLGKILWLIDEQAGVSLRGI